MFNPLRLFRRKEHIDDTAAAYIEGRATELEQVELDRRAANEPGLIEDLDSIRNTVSLLRSIEPVEAPRSFALAEAPVQVRVKRPKLALAPAVFAIVAAAAVGLLAVGNLADVVRQSGSDSDASSPTAAMTQDSAFAESSLAPDESILGTGPASGGEPDSENFLATGEGSRASATGTPGLLPTTVATDSSAFETAPVEIDPPAPVGSDPEDVQSLVPPAGGSSSTEIAPAGSEDGSGSQQAQELRTEDGDMTSEALPLPQETVIAAIDSGAEFGIANPTTPSLQEDPDGVALPLWQLQLSFASFAVLMAGAWFLLHRRLTA